MEAWKENVLSVLHDAQGRDATFACIAAATQQLGFEHFAYGLRLGLPVANPKTFMLNSYPAQWQKRYEDAGYLRTDPTVAHGQRSQTAIVWSDEVFQNATEMWSEAKSFDLRVGMAQSMFGDQGAVGMITISRATTSITAAEQRKIGSHVRWLAEVSHGLLSKTFERPMKPDQKQAALTCREIEVLKWMADGKTANDTADIMNLSTATVNFHVKNAVAKLDAPNKTSAVVKAVILGLLV